MLRSKQVLGQLFQLAERKGSSALEHFKAAAAANSCEAEIWEMLGELLASTDAPGTFPQAFGGPPSTRSHALYRDIKVSQCPSLGPHLQWAQTWMKTVSSGMRILGPFYAQSLTLRLDPGRVYQCIENWICVSG